MTQDTPYTREVKALGILGTDRAKLVEARNKLVGTTFIPHGTRFTADYQMAEMKRHSSSLLEHVRRSVVRRLLDQATSAGYSTTETLIEIHMGEFSEDRGYITAMHWRFPRATPDTGDPARIDGGPHHGERLKVPASSDRLLLLIDSDPVTWEPETTGPVRPAINDLIEYDLVGFDCGTGHWIYRPVGEKR